jgi:hypothetical protein
VVDGERKVTHGPSLKPTDVKRPTKVIFVSSAF